MPLLHAEVHLGANVQRLRKSRGWSQQQLANAVNRQVATEFGARSWQQPTVAKIESRTTRRTVTVTEALALAAALGVSLDELVTEPAAAQSLEIERLWLDYVAAMQAEAQAMQEQQRVAALLAAKGVDVRGRVDEWVQSMRSKADEETTA